MAENDTSVEGFRKLFEDNQRDPNGCGEVACCVEVERYGKHSHIPDAELAQAPNIQGAPLKASNPKDGIGATKLPLDLVPQTAIAMASLAHLDGALKYGKWNWRKAGVRASIYLAAARRHLAKWEDGDELDPDGVYHLGHVLACVNILIDAQACGKLFDDRPPKVNLEGYFAKLTGWVGRLTKKHAGKNPRHWTLADSDPLLDEPPLPGAEETK